MFIIANFYEMDFMKGVVILEKVDEMYKFLKSLLAYCFWSRDESDIVCNPFSRFHQNISLCTNS